jgi:superfamily II DNA/RNA helicase
MIIGTPGKLLDWITKRQFDASKIIAFVLDEADVMIGFE